MSTLILDAFSRILAMTATSSRSAKLGDDFDLAVIHALSETAKLTMIEADDWKANYPKHKKHVSKGSFDLSSLDSFDDGVVIDKPCGSQKWPDVLIVPKGFTVALPVENKSASTHTLQWNSTIPKKGFVYLAHSKKYGRTTAFLGEDIISDDDRALFEDVNKKHRELAEAANAKFKALGNKWSYFPRGKQDFTGNVFADNDLMAQRERRVFEHIEQYVSEHAPNLSQL